MFPCFVEASGFEPEMTEPKSIVLPLHHASIPLVASVGLEPTTPTLSDYGEIRTLCYLYHNQNPCSRGSICRSVVLYQLSYETYNIPILNNSQTYDLLYKSHCFENLKELHFLHELKFCPQFLRY